MAGKPKQTSTVAPLKTPAELLAEMIARLRDGTHLPEDAYMVAMYFISKSDEFVSHDDDPMLSYSEAGRMVGRSHQTIRNWVVEGFLKSARDASGLSRIRKSELTRFYGATAMAATKPIKLDALIDDAA